MNEPPTANQSMWESTPSRNLLLPENLELVRQALRNDGVVFGWHYYYAGGRSGEMFCFSNYDSYYQALLDSRPGDHFTVYSRTKLASKALLRLGDPRSSEPILNENLVEVQNALAAKNELVFVWCQARLDLGYIDCDAGVLWDLAEGELQQSLGLGSGRRGEFIFFTTQTLDEDEHGNPISSVSPGVKKRANAILDGKRPNEAGLTPPSGPY